MYDVGNVTNAVISDLVAGATYSFYATAYDKKGQQSGPSNTLVYTVPGVGQAPPPTSKFVKADPMTRGNWKGVYGSEGYWMVGAPTALPPYATVTTSASQYVWTPKTANPIAPLLPDGSTNRIAACWYSATQLAFDITPGDTNVHRVSAYIMDWSQSGRVERVDMFDLRSGALIDSRTLSNFSGGIYLTWDIVGAVGIRATPSNVNAVVSAFFFDPPTGASQQVTNSARFVQADTTTRGNWPSKYGKEGNWIIGAQGVWQTNVIVTPLSGAQWVWTNPTSNPIAPLLPGSTNRIAACRYSSAPFGFDVAFNDAQTHRLSFYFMDWSESGRQQRIDLIDPFTGTVFDSRMVTNFSGGIYLTWDVTGTVGLRITSQNVNGVVSGVFIDRSS